VTGVDAANPAWSAAALVRDMPMEPAVIARFLRLAAPAFSRCLARDQFTRDRRSKLVRLATVFNRAERVLGGRARAIEWLISSNRALSFNTPMGLLESRTGLQRVLDVLLRIEQGSFA
jgi:putative toxin-antitoxin system antitoxin component (TIGR02293 family)